MKVSVLNSEGLHEMRGIPDTVMAILHARNQPEMKGQVANIGSREEVSGLGSADKIRSVTEGRWEIIFAPQPTDDLSRRMLEFSKVSEVLNWFPVTSLEHDLAKTIPWLWARLLERTNADGRPESRFAT